MWRNMTFKHWTERFYKNAIYSRFWQNQCFPCKLLASVETYKFLTAQSCGEDGETNEDLKLGACGAKIRFKTVFDSLHNE